ncbi:cysteine desulfurase family protein [Sphingosinicella soli]|uniref:Cysteine desulfurase n=1 Tax=Sphingosinicella soli TaxID=333708 RepID=A0A7W7F9D1_9SPHN|nr:cysteine desulfurase family protein [Sphingosinicella soli]MBB4632528.1 cysteine desulfurase [Sphingosinicella soli]
MKTRLYLDWNATAPMDPAALDAMAEAARAWANPSSVHAEGRRAKALLEDSRDRIAAALGAFPQQLVFTSGGTEALALALNGAVAKRRLVLATEHAAVLAAAPDAEIVAVDATGVPCLPALFPGDLLAVSHANNETGVIQPVAEIVEAAHAAGARVVCDAVQTAGKLPLPPADFVAVSAHKLGGPPGVGALVVRCADDFAAIQKGGGQERGLRGGTENLVGIAGFAAAIEARRADTAWLDRAGTLRDRMEARLAALGAEIVAASAPRLPTTSMIRMPGIPAATQLIRFDMAGIAVSSGSACSSGKVGASHVLAAMGMPPASAAEAIRVSLGWSTTEAEIDAFCAVWETLAAARQAA